MRRISGDSLNPQPSTTNPDFLDWPRGRSFLIDSIKPSYPTPRFCRWALGIVRGRSFLVDGVDGKRKYRALVPVADLFNHMPGPNPKP